MDGVETCADCEVPLVDPAAPESALEDEAASHADWRFEDVCAPMSPAEIASITSALDAKGIHYWVYDQHTNLGLGSTVIPARIVVRQDQADEARKIIADLKSSTIEPYWSSRIPELFGAALRPLAEATHADDTASDLPCPVCEALLIDWRTVEATLRMCPDCAGIWLDADQLEAYVQLLTSQNPGAAAPAFEPADTSEVATCPSCATTSVEWGTLGTIPAGRCSECKGVFLSVKEEAPQ